MKALVFAAGKGIRMRPLTLAAPKPLIKLGGKALLRRILEALPAEISEIVLVVGYKGEMIKEEFGRSWQGKPIIYVDQKEQLGTWNALEISKAHLEREERFLVLNSDDIYAKEDLARLILEKRALLAYEVPDPGRFGVLMVDAGDNILDIEEGPENPKSNLVNTGAYVFGPEIFEYPPPISERGEYLITEGIQKYIRDHSMKAVRAKFWMPIGYPEDLERAEEFLRERAL